MTINDVKAPLLIKIFTNQMSITKVIPFNTQGIYLQNPLHDLMKHIRPLNKSLVDQVWLVIRFLFSPQTTSITYPNKACNKCHNTYTYISRCTHLVYKVSPFLNINV